MRHRLRFALPMMLAMVFAAAPAFAASSASDAYNGQGDVLDQTDNGGGNGPTTTTAPVTKAQPTSGSSLPFTGFDVILLLAGGFVLLGVGFTMRRMARPTTLKQ